MQLKISLMLDEGETEAALTVNGHKLTHETNSCVIPLPEGVTEVEVGNPVKYEE